MSSAYCTETVQRFTAQCTGCSAAIMIESNFTCIIYCGNDSPYCIHHSIQCKLTRFFLSSTPILSFPVFASCPPSLSPLSPFLSPFLSPSLSPLSPPCISLQHTGLWSYLNPLNFISTKTACKCFGISDEFYKTVLNPFHGFNFSTANIDALPVVALPVLDDIVPLTSTYSSNTQLYVFNKTAQYSIYATA